MSPRVPEAYLEARRTEIIEAAFKCFTEKGFHNTTMQDIYDATKLSPGAVYNYFSSKEDMLITAIQAFSGWSVASLASMISENPNESLIKIIRFWLSSMKQEDIGKGISVQLDFYSEATRNSKIREAVLRFQDATHDKLVECIEHQQQAGSLNAELAPLSIARAIMGMVFGIMIHKSIDPDVDLEAYGRVCEAILTGTFAIPPEKSRKTNKS